MKKILLFASALAGLFLAGCQRENLEPVQAGQQVTFTIEAPAALQTKAIADGLNVDELIYEVWITGQSQNVTDLSGATRLYQAKTDNKTVADGKVSFKITLDLVNDQNFTVLFWAQKKGINVYNTANLTGVTYTNTAANAYSANDNQLDAFYGKAFVSDGQTATPTVTLKRPFAQVNLCTLNSKDAAQTSDNYNISLVSSKMRLDAVPTTFNVATRAVSNYVAMEFAANTVPSGEDETITVNGQEYFYAGMNYVFAGANIVLTYDIQTKLNETVDANVNNTIQNVPLKENHRTNIVGNLLTSKTDFEIIVDAEFNANDYVIEGGANYVSVSSAEELAKVVEDIAEGNEEVNNIMLSGDIDLADLVLTRSAVVNNWTPIGTEEKPFTGVFDGNGYTIKNLALVETEAKEGKAFIGFFGYAKNATIKNVTFENVYINIPCLDIDHSQGHIGAVAGSLEGTSTIENVTVKGDIQVYATQEANGASRVAVVAGGNSYGDVTMKNVHVIANEGSYLKANNNTGALAGQLQGKSVFENCSSNIDVTVNKFFAGGLIGLAAGDQTFTNCHTTGNVAVVAGREGRNHDQYRVGGIAGGWADGATKVCTLVNCTYTGIVSGKNSDGSVANPLDYAGYVGRGYTLNGCQGSKVVIDGVEYVQKYNTAAQAGVYTINGLTPVTTADELVAALEANEGVYFMNDIKIDPANMSNAYGKTGINVKNGQTIDGNGKTLNIKGAGGTWDSGINTTGGLIKNLTVTGSFRGIFINHTSDHSEKVVLENVTITGTTYTISCDQGLYQGIEATNCTFNGWTSFAKTAGEAKFVNCSFGEGNGYKYCRPYSKTEFVECTFCPGYTVDTTQAEVIFTNCINQ